MSTFFELSPRAYSSTSRIVSLAWYVIYLPVYLCIWWEWRVRRPVWPEWTWSTYLVVNRLRIYNTMHYWRRLPPKDACEEELPPAPFQWYSKRFQCSIDRIICPPLPASFPRIGPLATARDLVDDRPRALFIVTADADYGREKLHEISRCEEKAILYIVGGGYIGGHSLSIHTPYSLANITWARVFCITYRKSLDDTSAFPGSLIDCLAGYRFLFKQGYQARNIMTCGDSAGGNACLALSRYLGEIKDEVGGLEMPGAIVANSPWADMTCSFPSYRKSMFTDHLFDLHTSAIPSHTRHFPGQIGDPYFSPALGSPGCFKHLAEANTMVYISGGTAERFWDEIVALYEGMRRDGVDVVLRHVDGGTHSDACLVDVVDCLGWSWCLVGADISRFWQSFVANSK